MYLSASRHYLQPGAAPTQEETIPENIDGLIGKDDLLRFAFRVFRALKVSDAHARLWAEVLIWADLRGVSSHGVMRIPAYANHIRLGEYNPVPDMRMQRLGGAAAILDADLAPGPVSYTHLDVYKRQPLENTASVSA